MKIATNNKKGYEEVVVVDDTYKSRDPREYTDYAPSIRAERDGFKVVTKNEEIEKAYVSEKGAKYILSPKRGMATDIYLKNGEKITSNDDTSHLRIRKLTPLECLRLMDFDDDDYLKMKEIESNTQIYAQAGNSIVVNCLVAIFGQMFDGKEEVYKERNNGIDV